MFRDLGRKEFKNLEFTICEVRFTIGELGFENPEEQILNKIGDLVPIAIGIGF